MAVDGDIIAKLAEAYLQQMLAEDEVWRATNEYDPTPPEYKREVESLDLFSSHLRDCLRLNDFSVIDEDAIKLLRSWKETNVDEKSLQYKVLCRELIKANMEAIPIIRKRMRGNYSGESLGKWLPKKLKDLEHIVKFQDSPIVIKARKKGAPRADWEAIIVELERMVGADQGLKQQSHIHICRLLADWYLREFKKSIKPQTIRGHKIMKPVLDDLLDT